MVNNLDVDLLEETGTINLNLTNYFSGPDTQGLFQKSTNPNGPLFETRSQFIDQSKFFGSDYFYTRIGLNLTDVQTQFELQSKRLVGDQFFQTKIIEEQLRTIAKNSLLLSKNENNVNNEIKTLLDNAADEYARLGLTTNDSLTQAQINSLEKDIIWFETKIIDGSAYIVPTIYLTQATRDALKNGDMATKSTIFAQEDVTIISSGGIVNAGSIAGNNVTLTAADNIINKNFSDITALNDLSITSTEGSISNFSNLKATNALSLTAAQDITNSATILTNAKNLLDSGNDAYLKNNSNSSDKGNISSTLIETAGIKAGTLTINAGNNFNNYAANITTTGNAEITAGNDVNIETLQTRNRKEIYWGSESNGGSRITDKTTNLQSEITAGNDLTLTSGNNVILQAVKLDSGNDLTIHSENLLLATAQDSSTFQETIKEKGSLTFKNTDRGAFNTTILNNEISSSSGTLNFNVNEQVIAQYHKKDVDSSAYLNDLRTQITSTNITFDVQKEIHKYYEQTNRGLTEAGQALVAVAASALIIATAGTAIAAAGATAAGSIGASAGVAASAGVGLTASAATATSIAAVSGTNASMNAGGLFDTLKHSTSTAFKDTTSSDSLKTIAVVGITAAAGNYLNTTILGPATANPTFVQIGMRSLAESTISNTTSSMIQSSINGDSFSKSLDNLGTNIAVGTIANLGAHQIGDTYKNGDISKPTQLALHAGLGAGVAKLSGSDALSGAVSGVVGEVIADSTFDHLNQNSTDENGIISNKDFMQNRNIAIQTAGFVAAASAVLVGNLTGEIDSEIADNIFAGQRIGGNAAANNSVAFGLDKTSVRFGHTIGYFQDTDGSWYRYEQSAAENASIPYYLANLGLKENISIDKLNEPNVENILKNHPDFVFIETTKEQDQKISEAAFKMKDTSDTRQYRIWTNNCLISFQNVCSAGNIQLPNNSTSRPDKFFESLREMYPLKN